MDRITPQTEESRAWQAFVCGRETGTAWISDCAVPHRLLMAPLRRADGSRGFHLQMPTRLVM
jgi:hypothetical protein